MHNIDAGASPLCCKGFFSVGKYKIKRGELRNSIIFFLNVAIKSACFEIFYEKSTNEEGKTERKKNDFTIQVC